jgi:uncharacterized protein YggE
VQDLTVANIDWRLSPEQKSAAESRIQAEAVARFQSKAQALTQQFGFAAYTLREVRVNAQEAGEGGVMPRMALASMDAAPAPMPTMATKAISAASRPYSMALTPFWRWREPLDRLVMGEVLCVCCFGAAGLMHRLQRVA